MRLTLAYLLGYTLGRAIVRADRWLSREVDALVLDRLARLTVDPVALNRDARAMRLRQMSSDWALWQKEMSA